MAIISGINDIKAKCLNLPFKKCRIVFRKGSPASNEVEFKLSALLNISITKHKDIILCYCDGVKKSTPIIKKELIINKEAIIEEEEEYNDVSLKDLFSDYSMCDKEDLKEDIEFIYQKEKKDWIHRFSKNPNLVDAINLDYNCDEEYCLERLSNEFPGFIKVDHTTFFYQKSCPSNIALNLEKRLNLQTSSSKSKYGTYSRIVKLESHNNVNYNDVETLVLFNYLNKFDVFALVSTIEEKWQITLM